MLLDLHTDFSGGKDVDLLIPSWTIFQFDPYSQRAALVAQWVKNVPAVQETQVPSLGWEDPLEKKMASHSSILAWRIPWTEEPGGLQSLGSQEVDTTEQLTLTLNSQRLGHRQ